MNIESRTNPNERNPKDCKITKDRPLIGPPLGGAVCFTAQASGFVFDLSGAAGLASLIIALIIGTTAGWLVEVASTRVIDLTRRKRKDTNRFR